MIVERFLDLVFNFILLVISWVPIISFPQMVTWDFSPLLSVLSLANVLLPTQAYTVVLVMWGVVWAVRFSLLPVRWLLAFVGR
jgi:hypothetical protein